MIVILMVPPLRHSFFSLHFMCITVRKLHVIKKKALYMSCISYDYLCRRICCCIDTQFWGMCGYHPTFLHLHAATQKACQAWHA